MLMLGVPKQEMKWPEAGITLELIPLTEDVDQKFVKETLIETRDEKGKLIDVKRDITKYAQLVGRHCIKGWTGVINSMREPMLCIEENIDQFMLIDVAQAFVFGKVKGLALHIINEVQEAKNG